MTILGVKCNQNSAKKILAKMDTDGNEEVDWAEFQAFFKSVTSSEQLKELLSKENHRYFEYKESVENDMAFSKTYVVPPSQAAAKKCVGHSDSVEKVAWLSDSRLVSGSTNGDICIWDMLVEKTSAVKSSGPKQVRAEKRFQVDINKSALYSMAASRCGQRLLVGLGSLSENFSLLDVEDGSCKCQYKGIEAAVYTCAFSYDGGQVAAGSQRGDLCIYDIERPDEALMSWHPHQNVVRSLCFRPGGMERGTLCSASADGTVKLFDTRARNPTNPSAPETVAEIPDAAASGTVHQAIFRGESELFTCGDDDCIRRWDQRALKNGCLSSFFGHTAAVKSIALSPDEKFLVSGTQNGSVRIWLADEEGLLRSKEEHLTSLLGKVNKEFKREEELFESGQLHEAAAIEQYGLNGERVKELEAQVSACVATREHRSALACTQALFSLDGPTVPINTVTWRESGGSAWIATGCQDPYVRLFDVPTTRLEELAFADPMSAT